MDPVIGTIIISLAIIALVAVCIRYLIKEHKKGGCAGCPSESICHAGCAGCPHAKQCQSQMDLLKKSQIDPLNKQKIDRSKTSDVV